MKWYAIILVALSCVASAQQPVKQTDGTNTVQVDPCQAQVRNVALISLTASAKIITGTSGKKTYICYLQFSLDANADNVALVEGTGTVCATGVTGMAGGSTAANGWNLLANGSVTSGTIQNWAFKSATNADDTCLLVGSGAKLSGVAQYVQQ